MEKISINEYMKRYSIKSRQTIYNQIKSNKIKSEKIGENVYIILENEENKISNDIELLKTKLKYLEEQNKELKEDKLKLYEDNKAYQNEYKNLQYNYNDLSKTVAQIEYIKADKEKENQRLLQELDNIRHQLEIEKSKKWYQKLFK